ncbi:MAG: hypothetical protein RLN70_13020, partial [Rhodospirillaceae bacterium]
LARIEEAQREVPGTLEDGPEESDDSILSAAPAPARGGASDRPPVTFSVVGYAGGSNVAGLVALSREHADTTAVARSVREQICAESFVVGGVDMALDVQVAVSATGAGESPLLALGRADHLLRAN